MNVFISGSISISKLPDSAIKKIDNIVEKNYTILIGDAKGVDLQVQNYIHKKNYTNVIVYFIGYKTRNNVGNWKTKGIDSDKNKKGRELYTLKDIAMAEDADYGLMIWDGKSHGTFNNIKEMRNRNKKFFVIIKENIMDENNIESIMNIFSKQKETRKIQLGLFEVGNGI